MKYALAGSVGVIMLASAGSTVSSSPPVIAGATLEPIALADVQGWMSDDHATAFVTFLATCKALPALREAVVRPKDLQQACDAGLRLAQSGTISTASARLFFEQNFDAYRVRPHSGAGFMTGYYEPEFQGSLVANVAYPTPVYGRPPDLVTRSPADQWPQVDAGLSASRKTAQGFEPYPDRGEIDDGFLAGKGLEIIWLKDPVDRFIMQVQGSARIRLDNGQTVRLAYAGRNGHAYTSLGRMLSEKEGIPPAQMTMDRLVARLKADPVKGNALIRHNRSFVFFRIAGELDQTTGPIGGAGIPLTPHRSIAADRTIWPYGLPVWLNGELPASAGSSHALERLTVIQDTGSAIVGPARLDLYFGSGPDAGDLAGRIRHPVDVTILWPRNVSVR